jgi:integrase
VPAAVYHALQAVEGLKAGRSEARETAAVLPVDEAHALSAAEFLPPPVKAMVELQLLTAMRPGEIIAMRACDIDTNGDDGTWTYTPAARKTAHHGHARQIILGPKARQILQPLLKSDMQAYIFSPVDAVEAMRAKRRAARKTPLSCGNRPRSNVRRRPRRQPGLRYSVESYAHTIYQACDKAFPPTAPWARRKGETREEWNARLGEEERNALRVWQKAHRFHPHQLRHTAATRIRKQFTLDAAQVILGHKQVSATQVYAEKNVEAARRVMAEVG